MCARWLRWVAAHAHPPKKRALVGEEGGGGVTAFFQRAERQTQNKKKRIIQHDCVDIDPKNHLTTIMRFFYDVGVPTFFSLAIGEKSTWGKSNVQPRPVFPDSVRGNSGSGVEQEQQQQQQQELSTRRYTRYLPGIYSLVDI